MAIVVPAGSQGPRSWRKAPHLASTVDRGGLPRFVERDFTRYRECGVLAHGFARLACAGCHAEVLVSFSCKSRGVCPSCNARRAHDTADRIERLGERGVVGEPESAEDAMSRARIVAGTALILALVASVFDLARHLASDPWSPVAFLVSALGATVATVALASLYESIVHRYVYHGPSPVPLLQGIHEIHQRGHHWHRFPPDRYVLHGQVERIPVSLLSEARPYELCGTVPRRWGAWAGQYALYLAVGIPFAFVPAWLLTANPVFTASSIISGLVVCYFFIRVHDVIHYPADRLMEGFGWFRFLDRHHYIHHMDTRVNLNFLLPLTDWIFGTMRRVPTAAEMRRWPTFEQAKILPGAEHAAADAELMAGAAAR